MAYTPMGGSPIINVLLYTHTVGSPVTFQIGLQIPVGGSPKHLVGVYTTDGGSSIYNILFYTPMCGSMLNWSKFLHT